jgi:hypothetical protein
MVWTSMSILCLSGKIMYRWVGVNWGCAETHCYQKHPKALWFKRKGWPHYKIMQNLMRSKNESVGRLFILKDRGWELITKWNLKRVRTLWSLLELHGAPRNITEFRWYALGTIPMRRPKQAEGFRCISVKLQKCWWLSAHDKMTTLCIYKVNDFLLSILPHQTLKTPSVLGLSCLLLSLPCFLCYILISDHL